MTAKDLDCQGFRLSLRELGCLGYGMNGVACFFSGAKTSDSIIGAGVPTVKLFGYVWMQTKNMIDFVVPT